MKTFSFTQLTQKDGFRAPKTNATFLSSTQWKKKEKEINVITTKVIQELY